MRLNEHDQAGPPCAPMETLLHKTADGSAGWFARAYAVAHAARCERCGAFLHNLEIGLDKMRESREGAAPDEAVARLEERLVAANEARRD